jgi:hypothetical protein
MEKINLFVVFHRSQEYYDNPMDFPQEGEIATASFQSLIQEWDNKFKVSWMEWRKRLTEITFMDVDKWRVDGIINWLDKPLVKSLRTLPGRTYVTQLDDDDWFHPQLFIDLKLALQEKKYTTAAWDCIEINPDFNGRGPGKYGTPVVNHKKLLRIRGADKILSKKGLRFPGQASWASLWGGTYAFNITDPKIPDLLGVQCPRHFSYIKNEKEQGRALVLTKQPYMFRLYHAAGRGWMRAQSQHKHQTFIMSNQQSFLKNFDGASIGFAKQIEAYKQLVNEALA